MVIESIKTVEVEVLKDVSDADSDFIAAWMAEAFFGSDYGPVNLTGRRYEDDPEAHRLLFRAIVDRGSVCGSILTTKARDGFRVEFQPHESNKVFDLDWRSGKDEAWDKLTERLGGRETWKAHMAPTRDLFVRAEEETFGAIRDRCFESLMFGVKKDCQGRGIGRAIQNHTVLKAEKAGAKFHFWSQYNNVPLYERLGCKVAKGDVRMPGLEAPRGYPEGSNVIAIMEAVRTT